MFFTLLNCTPAHELPDEGHAVQPLDEELAPVVLELLLPAELAPQIVELDPMVA